MSDFEDLVRGAGFDGPHAALADLLARMEASGEPPLRMVVSTDPQTGRVDVQGPLTPIDAERVAADLRVENTESDLADVIVTVGYYWDNG